VICCGGLGPTQDDITRDVIARVMGVEMRRDEAIAIKIREMFEIRGRVMSINNLRQADIPVGASPIAQMPGTAPGLVCPVGDKVIYAVPGVPREMKEMMLGTVLPDIARRAGQAAIIRSRVLRTWGLSESGIDEMLTDRMAELDKLGNPFIAFQASGIDGIKVRLTAKCDDEATARAMLDAEEKLIRGVLGDAVFGIDDASMESVVLDLLRRQGMTVGVAETLTGGILASRMTALDPTMQTYRGSLIAPGAARAAVSSPEERSLANAREARKYFGASLGFAAVAPEPDEGHAPGTVFQSIVAEDWQECEMVVLPSDRNRSREYAVISLLNVARRVLTARG
jgi:nicotinamide-nucleotide amidase